MIYMILMMIICKCRSSLLIIPIITIAYNRRYRRVISMTAIIRTAYNAVK